MFAARRVQGCGACLVLAPKSLLQAAWADDILRFAPHLTTSVAYAENRVKAFACIADVYITNTDASTWLAKQSPEFWKKFLGGMLIIDESSAYKHHTAARSKALHKFTKYFPFRHAMSGTPASNSITDLWHQVLILDDGKRLGTSFYAFRAHTCSAQQVGPMPNMLKWSDRPGIEQTVGKLIADLTIRHRFEDCIDIPEHALNVKQYRLSTKQAVIYRDLEENTVTQVQSGQVISAINGAVLLAKLMQVASGAVYDEQGNYAEVDDGRYDLVADLVEERAHCVVFFNWQHQRDALIRRMTMRGITYVVLDGRSTPKQREDAVKNFQAGFYRVILAHPQAAAHGLTLTKGTATIWASPTINLEHFLQGNRRIYRAGQTQKTETVVVIAPGTVEEKVAQRLQEKDAREISLLTLFERPSVKVSSPMSA